MDKEGTVKVLHWETDVGRLWKILWCRVALIRTRN